MTELDKFKRRLIRSVARLLLHERRPDDEVWEQLQKETGCDCKLLWERMRALTVKKLKRLLAADDRPEQVAAVARMSPTDWLLFDLVVVHEKCDVIARDSSSGRKEDEKQLVELVQMVHQYKIDDLSGDQLAEAWTNLTLAYNSTGRQCSAMLLQRRWYQLLEATREKFYKLWHSYRGNKGLWHKAREYMPTPLQANIAKQYPHVVTRPFMDWEERIQNRRVILRQEFEQRMRAKDKKNSADDDKPDLVVIEPVIETIDLGMESDEEGNQTRKQEGIVKVEPNAQDSTSFNLSKVKQETIEEVDGLSNVQIHETTHLPIECIDEDSTNSEAHDLLEQQSSDTVQKKQLNLKQQMSNFMQNTQEFEQGSAQTDEERVDTPDDLIQQKADEYFKSKIKTNFVEKKPIEEEKNIIEVEKATVQNADTVDENVVDDIIKQKADEFVKKVDMKKADASKVDMKKLVQDVVQDFELPSEMSFVDDGLEFVDDGIEYVEEEDDAKDADNVPADVKIKAEKREMPTEDIISLSAPPAKVEVKINIARKEEEKIEEKSEESEGNTAKFDLKLLMDPVVYTTKLDDMIVFKDKQFDSIQKIELIESILVESKPVSDRALKQIKGEPLDQVDASDTPEIVEDPVVGIEQHVDCDVDIEGHDKPEVETEGYDDADVDNEGYESSTSMDISEQLKVKPTSYLLQKPRSRSYNPIQLCKNPDFNTRLKRLTAGFFSYSRNRQLLSACKPMTIDLHKAFESKLVDGTLYLKPDVNSEPVSEQIEDDTCAQSATVVPSAMPIQSLLGNSNKNLNINELVARPVQVDTVDLTSRPTAEEIARNKVINLRDLSEIRRINQTLLTAEVTPIRVENRDNRPVTQVAQSQWDPPITVTEEDSHIKLPQEDELKIIGVAGGHLPISVHEPSSTRIEIQPKKTLMCDEPVRRRGPKPKSDKDQNGKPKQKPPIYAPMPGRVISVPWKSKLQQSVNIVEDGLITIDTLNRMINKLQGMDCDYNVKKNKIVWSIDRKLEVDTSKREDVGTSKREDVGTSKREDVGTPKRVDVGTSTPAFLDVDDSRDSINSTQKSEGKEPETSESNLETTKSSQTIDIGKTEPEVNKAETVKVSKKPNGRLGTRKYCCWSREKLVKIGTKGRLARKHLCGIICQCCCRFELLKKINQKNNIQQRPVMKRGPVYRTIELSDDETPESNPEQPVGEASVPTPRVRVTSSARPAPPAVPVQQHPQQEQQKNMRIPEPTVISLSGLIQAINESDALGRQETQPDKPAIKININFTESNETEPYIRVPAAMTTAPSNLTTQRTSQTTHTSDVDSNLLLQQIAANIPAETYRNKAPILRRTQTRPSIVIDGSNANHVKKNSMVILNSRNMANKPKESPIFLGKDKILLTTVRFPPNLVGDPPSEKPLQPTLTPTLTVPEGVQLVLLPNGSLTYHIDPNVELSQEQLAGLPKLISTVQEQLNTSYPQMVASNTTVANDGVMTIANDEPIVINDELTDVEKCITETPIEKRKPKHKEPDIDFECTEIRSFPEPVADGIQVVDQVSSALTERSAKQSANAIQERTDENVLNASDITNHSNNSKNSDIITIDESTPIVNATENKGNQTEKLNEGSSGGRNLLSDLMEMSGISAEDATPVQESAIPILENATPVLESATPVLENATPVLESATSVLESATPVVESIPQVINAANTFLGNKDMLPVISPIGIPTISELTPVTSLSELKYACAHQGRFFKLDFSTGLMVPINVCIKKNPKRVQRMLGRSETIDLTDDVEGENTPTPSPKYPTIHVQKSSIKPVKLFKSIHNPTSSLLRKRKYVDINKADVTNPKPIKILKRVRKQSIGKLEAKIDLVDSDAPMEEEYLVDNTDSDDSQTRVPRPNTNLPNTTTTVDSGDSSDEEPLAMKSMRIRESKNKDNETTGNNAEPGTSGNTPYGDKVMDTAASSEQTGEPQITVRSFNEVADDGTNMEVDEQFIEFAEDVAGDDQEDCILGV